MRESDPTLVANPEPISVDPSSSGAKTRSVDSFRLAGVLALTALSFASSLRFQFVYDDQGDIVENPLIQSWRFVPQYFKGHVWQQMAPNSLGNYYRPLNILWFRLNDALFGLRPAGWHATTILLHLLVTLCVYEVARRVTGRPVVSALTALLFGVHPMRHEVVAWVSGSTESLWSVMAFGAFLAYLKSREMEKDRWRWMALSVGLYAAAMLDKETAFVFPLLVFAHSWIYAENSEGIPTKAPWERFRMAASAALVYVPVAIAYLGVRLSVLKGFAHSVTVIPAAKVALTVPSVLLFYVRQWLFPIRLAEFYSLPVVDRFDILHVLLPVLALLLIAAVIWWFRNQLGRREVTFASVWMIVPLLPALDLGIFAHGQLVHDRYFYLPSFGAALLAALVLDKLAQGVRAPLVFGYPRAFALVVLAVLILLCYGTASASGNWADDYILFENAYRLDPGNAQVRSNLAIEYARRKEFDRAIPMLLQVLKDEPNNWLANYNLGRVLYNLGQLDAAEHYQERAVQINPGLPDSYMQLGLIQLRSNRLGLAEANMRRSAELRPLEPNIRFALGVTLQTEGKCGEARSEFAKAIALNPGFSKAREQMEKCRT